MLADSNPQSMMGTWSGTSSGALWLQSSFSGLSRRICTDSSSPRCSLEEYNAMYERSIGPNREAFCAEQAQSLRWMKPFRRMVHEDFQTGKFRWFKGGTLNVSNNCVDRWTVSAPDRTAIIYENDESIDVKRITFKDLLQETCRVASL